MERRQECCEEDFLVFVADNLDSIKGYILVSYNIVQGYCPCIQYLSSQCQRQGQLWKLQALQWSNMLG